LSENIAIGIDAISSYCSGVNPGLVPYGDRHPKDWAGKVKSGTGVVGLAGGMTTSTGPSSGSVEELKQPAQAMTHNTMTIIWNRMARHESMEEYAPG
jgi:hypothetical protein